LAKAGPAMGPFALFPLALFAVAVLATIDRAARDNRLRSIAATREIPLSRLKGWAATLVFAGLTAGLFFATAVLGATAVFRLSLPLTVAAASNALALLVAWRSEPWSPSNGFRRRDFFIDLKQIIRRLTAWPALFASTVVRGLVMASIAVLMLGSRGRVLNVV